MKYPRWNSYCTVKKKDGEAEITNHLLEESFYFPMDIARFGKQLDGKTDPYSIDETLTRADVRDLLETLEDYDCISKNRILLKTTGTLLCSLYIPQKITSNMRLFAWFYNKALQISFLPMLAFGIYYFSTHYIYGEGGMYIGMIFGLITGIFLHEISHACATLACGGDFFEIGVGILNFLPMGYALIDIKRVKSRFQRVQVNLAGVETNIFLCGLFLLFSGVCGVGVCSEAFLMAAIQNGFMGLLNLVFSNGFDGAKAMSELLGDRANSFIGKSRGLVWSKKKRQKVLSMGLSGYAIVASAFIFQILQLTFPALCIWNFLYIILEVF